jgi:hypothetical protein
LLVFSNTIKKSERIDIKVELKRKIGDQKIDIVIESDLSKPFTRLAYQTSVQL